MSQKVIHHIPDFHFDYYCIIPHTTDPQVLMLRDENGWSLPYFVPYEHHYGVVGHINQEIKVQLGLDVTTLHCFYDSEINDENYNRESKTVCRVYAMENHSTHWTTPTNASWINEDELNSLTFTNPKLGKILKLWFAEINKDKIARVPWAEPGWFQSAAAWIVLQLNTLGLIANTSIEQIKTWEISCLLKGSTAGENIYFKAVSTAFGNEASKTYLLAQIYPECMPNLLAVDTEKQWILMQEFAGKHLEKIADISKWEKALSLFASMQIQAIERVDELLEFGFYDRRLDQLISQIEPLFADTCVLLLEQNQGLSEAELETLRCLIPQLKAMCDRLAACGIPQTLVHGDFHCQNVVLTDRGYIYFDWSDAAIAHPFFDIIYFLQEYENKLPKVTDVQVRLRNAYLEPWRVYLPMKRLIHIFEKAQPLTLLSRAIVDYQVIGNMEDEAKQIWQQVIPYWLKKLLQQIQSGS